MYKTFAISLDESTSIMCCPRHGDTSDGYKWDVTLYKNHRITDSWAFTTESEARARRERRRPPLRQTSARQPTHGVAPSW